MIRLPSIYLGAIFSVLVLVSWCQAQNSGMTQYSYLTDYELTVFGESIPAFYESDTVEGKVHSNDSLRITGSPVFLDTISTSRSAFCQGPGYNPQFTYPPIFGAPRIYFPPEATELRELAQEQGFLFSDPLQETQYRMQLTGAQGWIMYEWRIGEPFDPEQAEIFYGPVPDDDAIFVDGYLELEGVFMGKATIGAHGSYDNNDLGKHCIRLLDDVRYWFANPYTGAFNDTTGGYEDRLLIISESNITIGNTWENGRENRSYGADIIITAGLIALGNEAEPHFWGCFSFEDQNDVGFTWEFSTGSYICPTPPSNDERGAIHLWGSLAQQRRGYVHRSNHSGTGYGRDYHYDNRFRYFDFVADIPANHNPLLWPEDIDFGEVQIGDSLILQTMLSNLGGTYIDINGATTSTSLFELVAGDTTVSLIPGDSRLYEIQFTPQELGEHTDTLLIDLQFGEDLYVPLRGIGTTLGISEPGHRPESFQLSAFPNPFNNEVRLSWTGLHDQGLLSIFDTFGREVYRAVVTPGINHLVWQPHHLSTGLYFLQLRTNDLTTTSKIVYVK